MNKFAPEILQLRLDVESKYGRSLTVPSDFEQLIAAIWSDIKQPIALSTLERLWGYVDGANQTRQSTLDILSAYIGYKDWSDYLHHLTLQTEGGSHTFMAPGVQTSSLQIDDRIDVSWLPNRHCVFRYLGEGQFIVEQAKNSKLHVGDTFCTAFMLEGYPMYAHHLIQNGQLPMYYVAGQQGGLSHVLKNRQF